MSGQHKQREPLNQSPMSSLTNAEPSQRGWRTRSYRLGDEVQLAELFNRVFERQVTPEWWLWKVRGRKGPVENAFVAVDAVDDHIVAQYVALPLQVRLAGRVRDVMVTVDTMTAPEYRRRGILNTLASEAYETWREGGVAAVFGLPNEQAKTPSNVRGWNTLFPMPWLRLRNPPQQVRNRLAISSSAALRTLAKVLNVPAIAQRHRILQNLAGVPGVSNIAIEDVREAGTEFDQLNAQMEEHYGNMVVRDAAWINWRYLQARRVGIDYKVVLARKDGMPAGYAAYRMNASTPVPTGLLADLFLAPGALDVGAALLVRSLRDMFTQKAGSTIFASTPHSAPAVLLTTLGFRPLGSEFHVDVVPLSTDLDLTELSSPERWLLTGADFDIV